jgi:hypothetical protein
MIQALKDAEQSEESIGEWIRLFPDGTRIDLNEIADYIFNVSKILDEDGIDEVRLQVVDGGCHIHTGDSQYDTDHRGAWGYGYIPIHCDIRDAMQIADELIDDAAEQYLMTQ